MRTGYFRLPGVLILIGMGLAALLAPGLVPHHPAHTELLNQFAPPDAIHWLGTDQFGRDVFSRALWGARNSLSSALLATVVAFSLGVVIGGLSGAAGGWLDWLLMRVVDVLLAFPGLLLAMVLVVIFGSGQWQTAIAVGIALSPTCCRVVRAAVLSIRSHSYIEAARVAGASTWRIMWLHLLPNVAGQSAAFVTVIVAWSLLNLAALDYLGLTGSPSVPTWGRLLGEGRAYLREAPWVALVPGVMLTLTVIVVAGLTDAWRRRLPGSHD